MRKFTYIVLLTYNNYIDTLYCLESLYKLSEEIKIIIIDTSKTDKASKCIKKWCLGMLKLDSEYNENIKECYYPFVDKPIEYKFITSEQICNNLKFDKMLIVREKRNLGFSGGNNIGIKIALSQNDCEYIWILNNDTIVKNDSLNELLNTVNIDNNTGLVGSVLLDFNKTEIVQTIGDVFVDNYNILKPVLNDESLDVAIKYIDKVNAVSGASFLATREFFHSIHDRLDDDFFLFFEEANLAKLAKNNGWKPKVSALSHVYHRGGASTKCTDTVFTIYNYYRSKYIYLRKQESIIYKYVIFIDLFKIIKHCLTFKSNIAKAMLKGIYRGCTCKLVSRIKSNEE